MAPSNNKVADSLLESAHDSAVHDGLRLAVDRYLEAVDALIAEDRGDEASAVLAELLSAKEKRRGFFLGKREQSPLGNQRATVASKYGRVMRDAAPTEASLDLLNLIAMEFPDDIDIRLTNARQLHQAGYLLDAVDEFKYCKGLRPGDLDLDVALGKLYVQLGRPDEAATQTQQAVARYVKSGNDDAAAGLSRRLLEFLPEGFGESLDAFASLTPVTLAARAEQLNAVSAAFVAAPPSDPAQRAAVVAKFGACYEPLLARDRANQALWQALSAVDASAADEIRRRLDGQAAAAAQPAAPEPPVTASTPASAGVLQPPSTPTPVVTPVAAKHVDETPQPVEPSQPAAEAAAPAPVPAPEVPKRPAAAGGLSAFAKRKALELFANSEYEAATVQLERVVKMSPDVEALEMLLECYLALEKLDEAARVGVLLADAELAAGNRPGAIATLTTLSKKVTDPALEQRRVELMQSR